MACWGRASSSFSGMSWGFRWLWFCWRFTASRTASMSRAGLTFRGQRSVQAKQLRQL